MQPQYQERNGPVASRNHHRVYGRPGVRWRLPDSYKTCVAVTTRPPDCLLENGKRIRSQPLFKILVFILKNTSISVLACRENGI